MKIPTNGGPSAPIKKAGEIMYAVAYEEYGPRPKADILHLHARNQGDALNKALRGLRAGVFGKSFKIVSIAPAIL